MRKTATLLLTSLLTALWAGQLNAHGPSRQKVVIEERIAAAPDKVWERIGNFNDMSWHPAIANTEGNGGNAIGATRTLTLGNGGKIFEKLEKYSDDKRSLFYRIENVDVNVLPVTNYSSWLSVKTDGESGSIVTWKGAFYRGYPNNDPPPELNDQAAVDAVTGVYSSGLANLKSLLQSGAK